MHPVFVRDFQSIIAVSAERLKKLAGSTILVTGCCGFIGSYLMDFFAYCNDNFFSEKCRIVWMDSAVERGRLAHLERRDDVELWLRDISALPPFSLSHVDWIINCAGVASPAVYRKMPLETMRVNAEGTRNMLELAFNFGVKGFLQMSSSEVYGNASIVPTPENYIGAIQPLGPRSCYDISKLFGETLCHLYHQERGVPVKIARPFNIYGIGAVNDGRIIPELMAAVIEDKRFVVHGSGTATRSYCYISDAAVQFLAILTDGVSGEAYNVGSGDADLSVVQVIRLAQEIFDGRPRVTENDALVLTRDQPGRRKPNIEKATNLCGRSWKIPLRDGLQRVYESMKGESHA